MIKPKKSVEQMSGYFVPMYEKDWDIKIDSNENNYGPSPKVLQAIKNCDVKQTSYYPFYGELSKKIADYQGFDIDNIKVTNGADEAIQSIIQTYLEVGDALLTLDISFEMPVIYTQIQNGKIIKVPFQEKWKFPIDSFLKELNNTKIKIVYIASPNNPTGSIVKEDDLIKIFKKAKDKVIILDETYANYSDITNKKYVNDYDNLFIVRSFSKDFALAGLRLGYIISNSENIKNLKKVVSPFSVNTVAIAAGIAALDSTLFFEHIKEEITSTKADLKAFLESMGGLVYPSNANFLLVDFKQKAEFVYHKLKQENISVKLFKDNSPLKGHLRITIPTKSGFEKIKEALKIKPYLVFDMDGVLIDARNSYRLTIEKVYEKYTGKTVTPEKIQAIKNQGGFNNDWDLTKYLLEQEGCNASYDEIVNCFQDIYWNDGKGLINNEQPLFDRQIFEKLSKDYNISIFTGRLRQEAMFALKRFNVQDLFYPLITTDDIPKGMEKPNPFGLNMTKNITISDRYYYFGDTTDDILAAKGAKYHAYGILPPQDKSNNLKNLMLEKGAEDVLNSVNDIIIKIQGSEYEKLH